MHHLTQLGSATLPSQLQRAGTGLRAEVQRQSAELSSGRTADPRGRWQGDHGAAARIEARLQRLAAQDMALLAQGQRYAAVEAGLAQTGVLHDALRAATLAAAAGEMSPTGLARIGAQGRQTLDDMLSVLGRSLAGQALFSGDRPDRPPLAPGAVIMGAAAAAVAGAGSADEVVQRLEDLFLIPGGTFETTLYLGGAAALPDPAAHDGSLAPPPTAAETGLRRTLASAVLVALAGDAAVLPDASLRRAVLDRAIPLQASAAAQVTDLRASLGTTEAVLAERRVRLATERDSLELVRQQRIAVDPFEAATRLEEVRTRLEALYLVTARVARLSLTGFLR
jgi:flagellar hook-associated protein 3 FlgL